ncbi:MAG: hypothetical protein WA369_10250 [Candidatus Acidiferrales bacterium]
MLIVNAVIITISLNVVKNRAQEALPAAGPIANVALSVAEMLAKSTPDEFCVEP